MCNVQLVSFYTHPCPVLPYCLTLDELNGLESFTNVSSGEVEAEVEQVLHGHKVTESPSGGTGQVSSSVAPAGVKLQILYSLVNKDLFQGVHLNIIKVDLRIRLSIN